PAEASVGLPIPPAGRGGRVGDHDLRLVDLLAALSVATDLGMGQEPEKAVRGSLVATGLARAMDLPDRDLADIFYTTLLQHVGCTAPAHEIAHSLGDGPAILPLAERTDSASRRERLVPPAAAGKEGDRAVNRAVCEVGALMADRLRLGEGVRLGLLQSLERWDGKGDAHGLAGDDIALPARFTALATQVVIFDRLGGPAAALAMVRRRAGGWFDPALAERFERVGAKLLHRLAEADVWAEVLAAGARGGPPLPPAPPRAG